MDVLDWLFLIGFGVFVLIALGAMIYWHLEDQELDRQLDHIGWYFRNRLKPEKMCLDARKRALDDAIFWNDLARTYIDAGLYNDACKYMTMAREILNGMSDRFYKEV